MTSDSCADLISRLASRLMIIEFAKKKLAAKVGDEVQHHISELDSALDESMQHVRTLQLVLNSK